jgi:hypothetical protein
MASGVNTVWSSNFAWQRATQLAHRFQLLAQRLIVRLLVDAVPVGGFVHGPVLDRGLRVRHAGGGGEHAQARRDSASAG